MTARRRTDRQREAWRALPRWWRKLVMSERPDELERLTTFRQDLFADLESAMGDRVWDATIAALAEGEPTAVDLRGGDDASLEMGLTEIGHELGLSRERVRQIEMSALQKMRADPVLYEFMFGERPFAEDRRAAVDAAIERTATEPEAAE